MPAKEGIARGRGQIMRNEPGRYYLVILSEKQLTPRYRKSVLQDMRAAGLWSVFIHGRRRLNKSAG